MLHLLWRVHYFADCGHCKFHTGLICLENERIFWIFFSNKIFSVSKAPRRMCAGNVSFRLPYHSDESRNCGRNVILYYK